MGLLDDSADQLVEVRETPPRGPRGRGRPAKAFVLTAAAREGAFVELDAADTLRLFLLDGVPDVVLFQGTVGQFVRDQAVRGPVRAYGGMVPLLWSQGYARGALALEGLWNQLRGSVGFSLLCAYPAHGMDARARADVCRTHSAIAA